MVAFTTTRTDKPRKSNQQPQVRAESPHCVCRHGPRCACICGQVLRACQHVLLPLKHLANRPSSYSKHCDEETACGSQWTVFGVVVSRLPGCVTVVAYFAHPVYLQYV